MTNFLPVLLLRPSPNSSGRHGMRGPHSLARLRGRVHDCAGGYEGSIRWFELSRSNVSAHYVVREDGGEATQMVNSPTVPATRALQSTLRRRRDGGFASRGFDASLPGTTARIFAYLCYHLQIPVRHARAGVGPRITSLVISALQAVAITILRPERLSSVSSFASVCEPAIPSARIPACIWKLVTTCRVSGP